MLCLNAQTHQAATANCSECYVFRPTPKVIYSSSCLFSPFSLFFYLLCFFVVFVVAVEFIIKSQYETKASFCYASAGNTLKKRTHTASVSDYACSPSIFTASVDSMLAFYPIRFDVALGA